MVTRLEGGDAVFLPEIPVSFYLYVSVNTYYFAKLQLNYHD